MFKEVIKYDFNIYNITKVNMTDFYNKIKDTINSPFLDNISSLPVYTLSPINYKICYIYYPSVKKLEKRIGLDNYRTKIKYNRKLKRKIRIHMSYKMDIVKNDNIIREIENVLRKCKINKIYDKKRKEVE